MNPPLSKHSLFRLVGSMIGKVHITLRYIALRTYNQTKGTLPPKTENHRYASTVTDSRYTCPFSTHGNSVKSKFGQLKQLCEYVLKHHPGYNTMCGICFLTRTKPDLHTHKTVLSWTRHRLTFHRKDPVIYFCPRCCTANLNGQHIRNICRTVLILISQS